MKINIEYEYYSKNILRKRDKPFSTSKLEENVLIWIYDNFKRDSKINSVNFSVTFHNIIDANQITVYPEKYQIVNK